MSGLRQMIQWATQKIVPAKTKASISVAEAQGEHLDKLLGDIRKAVRAYDE